LSETAFLLPIRAPVIEAVIESTNPKHNIIPYDSFQKAVSAIALTMP